MKKQRLMLMVFSVAFMFCCIVILSLPKDGFAGTISLPKTGQTKCYDTVGTQIACTGTGQDGDYRQGLHGPARGLQTTVTALLAIILQG